MRIQFRQGIVSYPEVSGTGQAFLQSAGSGDFNILTASGDTVVTLAHRTADYLHVETSPITPAWTGVPTSGNVWLYWDINPQTGIVTYGHTTVKPTAGSAQPGTLTNDLHWFDTSVNVMKVYDGTRFLEKIRVFAARVNGTSISPVGSNTSSPFAGTQIGNNNTIFAGQILFSNGLPIIESTSGSFSPSATNPFARSYTFATTETEFLTGGSQKVNAIRLESDFVTAQANGNLAAYDVVKWSSFGVIEPAGYNDTEETTLGMIVENVQDAEIGTVIVQGVITNEQWNWPNIGAELFVRTNGELTENDPNTTNPSQFPQSKPPVARVLSKKEIVFMQGLGKVGPRGPKGEAGGATILDELSDVTVGSPLQTNMFLHYDGTEWNNVTREEGNVGYLRVNPAIRNSSEPFVIDDAGNAVMRTDAGSPVTAVTWTLNTGVFQKGDMITLSRRLGSGNVTISPGSNVLIESALDSNVAGGSPNLTLTLDNPSQATLWFVEETGSPTVETWIINGTVTFN